MQALLYMYEPLSDSVLGITGQVALMIKILPSNAGDLVWSLGQEDLEKEMATHSNILAGSLVGYIPRGHKRVGHNLETKQKEIKKKMV